MLRHFGAEVHATTSPGKQALKGLVLGFVRSDYLARLSILTRRINKVPGNIFPVRRQPQCLQV